MSSWPPVWRFAVVRHHPPLWMYIPFVYFWDRVSIWNQVSCELMSLLSQLSRVLGDLFFSFFFFFWSGLEFELCTSKQALYCLSHTSSSFCSDYFGDRVSQTICPGWHWTKILLTSAYKVSWIVGVSHWHPAAIIFLIYLFTYKHLTVKNIYISIYICIIYTYNTVGKLGTGGSHLWS
jgi:hypothetical protein